MVAAAGLWAWRDGWTGERLVEALSVLPPSLVAAAAMLLPLAGFSIGIIYLAVGAAFSPAVAGAVVAGITVFHLSCMHLLGRSALRPRLIRALKRHGRELPTVPPGEEWSVALGLAVVPGIPYWIRNASLAISGVPWRVYLPVCLPIYVVRSYLALLIGGLGQGITWEKGAWLAGVLLLKITLCLWIVTRLRHRLVRV